MTHTPEVTCFVPGTITTPPQTQITSGQVVTMVEIHPDGADPNMRRWIRAKGDLATWASGADLKVGTQIIVAGSPYLSPVASRGQPKEVWLVDATRIAVDLTNAVP